VIELDPQDASAWEERAVYLYEESQRLEESLACLDKAVEIETNSPGLWSNRGVALSSVGRHDEALESFDKAMKLDAGISYFAFNRAATLMALNRWTEGIGELEDTLSRFARTSRTDTGDEVAIVRNLFIRTHDATAWRRHIKIWVELFSKHRLGATLAHGLVKSIRAVILPKVSTSTALEWRDAWQELAGNRSEFQLTLRLLDVAVRYRETKDQRVLLELPIEERELLNQVFNVEEHVEK
jgi:tetratricopeptide (TPR) repeat protein